MGYTYRIARYTCIKVALDIASVVCKSFSKKTMKYTDCCTQPYFPREAAMVEKNVIVSFSETLFIRSLSKRWKSRWTLSWRNHGKAYRPSLQLPRRYHSRMPITRRTRPLTYSLTPFPYHHTAPSSCPHHPYLRPYPILQRRHVRYYANQFSPTTKSR